MSDVTPISDATSVNTPSFLKIKNDEIITNTEIDQISFSVKLK
jgi:hypothetical protein